MKRFFGSYAIVLILTVAFLVFGGTMLLDFSRHFWTAVAFTAFLLTVLVNVLYKQIVKIEDLEKRIQDLEQKKENDL